MPKSIANHGVHPPVAEPCGSEIERRGNTVEGFREAFETTQFAESGDEHKVFVLFEKTLNKGMRSASNSK